MDEYKKGTLKLSEHELLGGINREGALTLPTEQGVLEKHACYSLEIVI